MFNKEKIQGLFISFILCLFISPTLIYGQKNINKELVQKVETIAQLVENKKFYEAEIILDTMLKADARNINLLLARATVLSHQKKYHQAEYDFRKVLNINPNHITALVGLAYNYSWSGNYSKAEKYFKKVLDLSPGNREASKGLAYVILWKGNVKESIERFKILAKETPDNSEILVGLGQAYLKINKKDEARRSFSRALEFEPSRADAKEGYKETISEPKKQDRYTPKIDFTLLGGYTKSETEGTPGTTNETGLRFVEVAVEPTRKSRVWFQYDNGLSLDNSSLARSNERAPTYWIGGLVNYKRNYLTKFAYGRRNLPDNVTQNLFDVEQVFFLPKNYSYNVGAIFGPRSDNRTEFTFHTGVGVPIGERLRLEPTVFYAQSGLPGERQFRGLIAGDYRFSNGFKVGGGFAAGKAFRPDPLSDDNVTDVFFRASAPVWKYVRPQFLARREKIGNSTTTIITFGFTISNKEIK